MKLVIVESPSKAKTIEKYLGKDFKVLASYGHIRNIPSKAGSIDTEHGFDISWQDSPKATKHLKVLKQAAKEAEALYLTTDPDREGEAISWHILRYLKEKRALKASVPVKRVVFNSITKAAILEAFKHPRDIDEKLVSAYLARISLDYLVGFNISPILWHKLPGSKSAGRVQSVALRLLCERENEREDFKIQEYWSLESQLNPPREAQGDSGPEKLPSTIPAILAEVEGKKLSKLDIAVEKEALKLKEQILSSKTYAVSKVVKTKLTRNPFAPFTTSSLQQDAFNKLGFSAKKTMLLAQKLYEGVKVGNTNVGVITYIRTDAIDIHPGFIQQMRDYIDRVYGKEYLSKSVRMYKTKAKNAQEAHEAIRPTHIEYNPTSLTKTLTKDELALYTLIWNRSISSQMASANYSSQSILLQNEAKNLTLKASGSVLEFAGFYKCYGKSSTAKDTFLPPLNEGDSLTIKSCEALQHFTEPPPRYSEATLVKTLEELGIGRPSTYASIISLITQRGYGTITAKRFHPTERGRILNSFLTSFFTRYVDYDFTSKMEIGLDQISSGEVSKQALLGEFWQEFKAKVDEAKNIAPNSIVEAINKSLADRVIGEDRSCPTCKKGELLVKYSRFGAFIGCSNYPDCNYIRNFHHEEEKELTNTEPTPDAKVLGVHPISGKEIFLKSGPYGPYVEIEKVAETKESPKSAKTTKAKTTKPTSTKKKVSSKVKRASLPKNIKAEELTLEQAVKLLDMPYLLDGTKDIYVGQGRFGPYLKQKEKFYSLKVSNIFQLTAEEALSIINAAKAKAKK